MKIKIFITTYNNNAILQERSLNSLINSKYPRDKVEIYIIDNYGDVILQDNKLNIKILHNQLRSKHSTGHLARNWNQSIILGFEDLDAPLCDIVLTAQNDAVFDPEWYNKLSFLSTQYAIYNKALEMKFKYSHQTV